MKIYLFVLALLCWILIAMVPAQHPYRTLCQGILYITNSFNERKFEQLKGKVLEKDSESTTHESKVLITGFEEAKVEHDFHVQISYSATYKKYSEERQVVEKEYNKLLAELEQCLNIKPVKDDNAKSMMATYTKNGVEIVLTAYLHDAKQKYIELEVNKELEY